VIKIEDVKSFHQSTLGNPTGYSRLYKQVNWWKFLGITDWNNEISMKNMKENLG